MSEKYNNTYFEEGVAKGVSGYTNYTWMPEFTIPLAHRIIRRLRILPGERVLDYGCAKGYLVRALRLLDIQACGCDISEYALRHCHPEVREYVYSSTEFGKESYDWVIAKDVLEHLTQIELMNFLILAKRITKNLFIIVPLGDGEKYIIPQYEKDVTHILRWTLQQWRDAFIKHDWLATSMDTNMIGLKDSWKHHKNGNAAFTLRQIRESSL